MYGDACDPDFIGALPLNQVKWVITALPQHDLGLTHEDPRIALIDGLKHHNYAGQIAVSTQNPDDAQYLKDKGADLVFEPFYDAANIAVRQIRENQS